jgi:NTP pyrophosphatase (non-canonical NTP hydrolase)
MPITHGGASKLIEECGELQQALGKYLTYGMDQPHPDGKGPMRGRIEDEIADVMAACRYMIEKQGLHTGKIYKRMHEKIDLFQSWEKRE